MKIIEILEDFWYRLRWAKVIVLAGVIIPYFAAKEFLERFSERKKRKGGGI